MALPFSRFLSSVYLKENSTRDLEAPPAIYIQWGSMCLVAADMFSKAGRRKLRAEPRLPKYGVLFESKFWRF